MVRTGQISSGGTEGDALILEAGRYVPAGAATLPLRLPSGTATERPGSPAEGMIRYSTDLDRVEVFDGTSWRTLGRNAGVAARIDGSSMTLSSKGYYVFATNVGFIDPPLSFDSTTGYLTLPKGYWLLYSLLTINETAPAPSTYHDTVYVYWDDAGNKADTAWQACFENLETWSRHAQANRVYAFTANVTTVYVDGAPEQWRSRLYYANQGGQIQVLGAPYSYWGAVRLD